MKFSWRGGKKADSTAPAPVAGATPDADLTSIAPSRHSDAGSGAALVSNEKAGPPLTKKQKAMRHCARFKWWYLIAGILLLAIILPITFKVIIPAIVQAVVSHQGLPVHSGFFKVASPDVLIVSLNTTLNTPLPIHLDPLTMSLSRNAEEQDTPFTNFIIPAMRVKGLTETVFKNQTCPVVSPIQLGVWVADLFDKPNVSIHVKGNPSVYLGILHSNNHLSKTLTIPALNGFAGKTLDKLELNLERDSEGNNIAGAINLPNAGVLGLELGNLTLNLFSGDLKIGNVTLVNVTLNQGPNPIPFKGVLDLRAIIQNLGTVLTSQSQALGRGDIDLNSTISSVVVDGQHIPYLEQVLSTRTLTFSINVVTLIADVLASLLHSDRKNLGDLVDEIVGNKTLINEINSHWNSSEAKLIGSNHASNPFEGFKAMRRVSRDNLAWEMLKLSMKMKRNRV